MIEILFIRLNLLFNSVNLLSFALALRAKIIIIIIRVIDTILIFN